MMQILECCWCWACILWIRLSTSPSCEETTRHKQIYSYHSLYKTTDYLTLGFPFFMDQLGFVILGFPQNRKFSCAKVLQWSFCTKWLFCMKLCNFYLKRKKIFAQFLHNFRAKTNVWKPYLWRPYKTFPEAIAGKKDKL